MTHLRLIPSAGGAIFVTTVIGLAMAAMIRTEFKAQDVVETAAFEINPVAEEIKPDPVRKAPNELAKVEIPPAPPSIDKGKSEKPEIDVKVIEGRDLDWTPPDIDFTDKIIVVDGDPSPIFRLPPVMPKRADRSGHCNMSFSVSLDGSPFNISAVNCTQKLFERAAIRSVEEWKYKPKVVNGRPAIMRGLETKISFKLNDENGKPIPE